MVLFIIGIILFILLVVVHELGHFWAAKRNGVETEEFGIFFPPRLYKKRMKGGWDFTINLLPLGGFVKLKGETDSDKRPGSFGAATDWAKAKIMLAGVGVNLLTALVLFMLLALIGMPKLIDNQFTVASDTHIVKQEVIMSYVEPDSPADKAGLRDRDVLVAIGLPASVVEGCDAQICDTQTISSADTVRQVTEDTLTKSSELVLEVKRSGETKYIQVTPNSLEAVTASEKTDNPKAYLGVVPTEYTIQRSTWSAPVVAVGLTGQLTKLTFQGLGNALQGLGGIVAGAVTGNTQARQSAQTEASDQVSGPVGIFVILQSGSSLGFQFMLMIIAVISLTLAIMNVLPIPALDGGRLFVMGLARVLKRPLTPKLEEGIYAAGFLFLISLIVLITLVDIKRFF